MSTNSGKNVVKSTDKKKARTAMSCDSCKRRKTKCNNPVPGPCDYCCSTGAECLIDTGKRKKRPFYFVSEEEHDLMRKILQQCFPGRELDLAELRELAVQLQDDTVQHTHVRHVKGDVADHGRHENHPPANRQDKSEPTANSDGGLVLEEIGTLHEEMGCLLKDSRGQYRYVGADSGISFNAAVRGLTELKLDPVSAKLEKDVIPGMKTATIPPGTSQNISTQVVLPSEVDLPPRELCLQYVDRYFIEVHSLFWLYSLDQFHSRLEGTYVGCENLSASWICSLYAIFALGSLHESDSGHRKGNRSSQDFLAMAKALLPQVCDEADLDSIRALILLALALQANCFMNTAYLHIGTACRIAFSLGLHVDKLYYTLYIFEQEAALRSGKPCSIAPYGASWEPPLPLNDAVNPETIPLGYLDASINLTRLTKMTCRTLYNEPKRKLLSPEVAAILSALQQWAYSLPPSLCRINQLSPIHKRPVALLQVRYWSVIILATRPCLLCSVVREKELQGTEKKKCYDELSNICVDAATHSLEVLRILGTESLLTSLIPSVFNYVLELVQVFLAAFTRNRADMHIESISGCVKILESMDNVGWTLRARPEVMYQLREQGIVNSRQTLSFQPVSQTFEPLAAVNELGFPDLLFAPDSVQYGNLGYESMMANDMDFGDNAATEALYQQLMTTGKMRTFNTPP